MINSKKTFLLIFIVFLLQSCSGIKIVIEKDCNCENKNIEKNISKNNLDGIEKNIEDNFEKPKLIKYLTGKFTVNQDEKNTYVYYKNKMFLKIENNISSFDEDEIEEKPIIKEDIDILKRELVKKIIVKNIEKNFYIIELENSKNGNYKTLVDIKEKKSWNISFVKSPFEKIVFGRSGKYFMYNGGENCNGGLFYINNSSFELKKIFENDCNYSGDYPDSYKEIKSFGLGTGKIKVTFIDSFGDKQIEKIDLESIK